MRKKITIAAAHLSPVYLDAGATVEKACHFIRKAAKKGVQLLAFPESFVPGFPLWPALSAPIHNHDLFKKFASNSIRIPGPEIIKLCSTARETGIIVSIGISESTDNSVGCLWNSNLIIGSDGAIINHHRKIVPTFFEKLIWANGDGHGLNVVDTEIGSVGALICGENTNPLARYALMAQGEQIHISSYPPTWPTHEPSDNNRYDLAAAIRIRAGAHSFEAKAFNIVASSRIDETTSDVLRTMGEESIKIIRDSPKGISMIIGPSGMTIAETSVDSDTLLIENINLDDCIVPKQFHDLVGYYNRFDIFDLRINRRALEPATFEGEIPQTRELSFNQIKKLLSIQRTDKN